MLQELTAQSNATAWAIGSMLFFVGVYILVAVKVFRARTDVLDGHARRALDDGDACAPPPGSAAAGH
jgi:hypothetical protein